MKTLSKRPRVAVVAIATVAFLVECLLIRGGILRSERFGDVSLYSADAHRMLHGRDPVPGLLLRVPTGSARRVHRSRGLDRALPDTVQDLDGAAGRCDACVAAAIAAAAGQTPRRTALGLAWIAAMPLLLGPLVLDEYDIWPALVTCSALLALLRGRDGVGAGLLGFGAATKVFPAAVLP